MRVLIAEDEEITRTFLKKFLEKMGHEVIECQNGQDVLGKLFVGELPQLVILDWMMPGPVDGLQVCAKLRERQDLPYTYIIMLTSRSESDDVITGLRSGANDYITKPLKPEELQMRVQAGVQMVELNKIVVDQRLRLVQSAKMAVLGEMANGVAHEINNPLTVIIGHANCLLEMAKAKVSDANSLMKSAESIQKTSMRIAKIVSSLKTFSADTDSEPFRQISVRTFIDDVVSFCEAKIGYLGIELRIGDIPEGLSFEIQPSQMCQALLNLVNNSVDAVSDKQTKWIDITVSRDSHNVLIAVTDSGSGIPENIQSKIMQPFFTTKDVGKGTGLGLSVTKGILEYHHGHVALDKVSLNTRFVLTVPFKQTKMAA